MNHHLTPYIDAAFPLRGDTIPLDHGYPLFAALSRILPDLHEKPHWGVHPVLGSRRGPGILALIPRSRLKLRLPTEEAGRIMPLVGRTLDIDGATCTLGAPRLLPLITAPHLKARLVTIKGFVDDPDAFVLAMRRQIARIPHLGQDLERVDIQLGPRRVLRIKSQAIVGHAVALTGLDADASLAIQCTGVGGRRHMGAGIFVPPARSA
jgi:CRISPR-associated protein Cas6